MQDKTSALYEQDLLVENNIREMIRDKVISDPEYLRTFFAGMSKYESGFSGRFLSDPLLTDEEREALKLCLQS